MTERPAPPARRTPGAGLALGLVLVVAVGFLVVGVPLQILFGEMGIVLSQFFVLLLPAVLLVRLGRFDAAATFSLRMPTPRAIGGGLVALLGGIQVAWALTWLQSLVVPVPTEYLEAMASALTPDSFARFLQLLFVAALVPAIAEEALFRGVVLSGLRSRLPPFWAVLGAGLVFGAFHLTPETAFRFVPTAWLGVLLAWIVVLSGSLPLAALLHFVNNGLILALTAIPVTRETMGEPEAGPPLLLVPVGAALLVWGLRTVAAAGRSAAEGAVPGGGDAEA